MLSEDRNQLLTRVGPGTRMGNLLRRYWHPIAAVSDLDREPVVPVRLFGEDLVLYRDRGGRYGLLLDFVEHDYGFSYRRVRTDTDERDPLWTIGRICLWPNGFFLGQHFEWRVPVDDENTLSVVWSFIRVPKEAEPYVQESIPAWRSPTTDSNTGKWITSHVINQDIVAWVGQGRIADRTRERLGASDRGIGLLRRRLFTISTRSRQAAILQRSCAIRRTMPGSSCRSSIVNSSGTG